MYVYQLWQFRLWSFKDGIVRKLERFWLKLHSGPMKSLKEAIWIALVGLFVHVDIKYWDFLTLEGTFITPTFCVRVMKVPSVSLILPYFMVFFRFCHFLSLFITFSTMIWIALKYPIFSRFRVPGVMKIRENWRVRFLQGHMYPGSWILEKIEASDFC